MLRWTVGMLIAAIASLMVVSACGASAGGLATGTGGGAEVQSPVYPTPVVLPSPERPAGPVGLPHVARSE
jgi:hypothetical protein